MAHTWRMVFLELISQAAMLRSLRLMASLLAILVVAPCAVYAQQWSGDTTSTGIIYRSGRVGIGLTSPSANLDILSASNSIPPLWVKGAYFDGSDATATDPHHVSYAVFDHLHTGTTGFARHLSLSMNSQPGARLGIFGQLINGSVTSSKFYINTNPSEVLAWSSPDFVITDQGRVGIGLPAPLYTLAVKGDMRIGDGEVYRDLVLQTGVALTGYNGTFDVYPRTIPGSGLAKHATHFKTNANGTGETRHDVIVDGRLGIGVTDPQRELDIDGTINARGNAGSNFYGLVLSRSNSNMAAPDVFSTSADNTLVLGGDGSGQGDVVTSSNVGIGIVAPGKPLHVKDDFDAPIRVESSDAFSGIEYVDPVTGTGNVYTAAYNGQFLVQTQGTNRLTISPSGTVGIAAPSSGYALDVAGTINADSLLVNGQPFSGGGAWGTSNDDVFYNGGNVGIGTTTPEGILNIVTDSSTDKISLHRGGHDQFYAQANGVVGWGPSSVQGILTWDTGKSMIRAASGNALTFQTNGSFDRMTIDSDGDVGIGTPTPGAKLDVVGSGTGGTYALQANNTGLGEGIRINTQDATGNNGLVWFQGANEMFNVFSDSQDDAILRLGNSNVATVQLSTDGYSYFNGGNVGIGITDPQSKLVVTDTGTSGRIISVKSTSSSGGAALSLANDTGKEYQVQAVGSGIAGDRAGDFEIRDTGTGAVRLTVDTGGNVGIGTTSPSSPLHINTANSTPLRLTSDAARMGIILEDTGSGGETWELRNDRSTGDITGGGFGIYDASAGEYGLVIATSGNVGIGTTSPGYALDVAGIINADSLLVNGQPFSGGSAWTTSNDDLYYSAGKVGIGTLTPSVKLDVADEGQTSIRVHSTNGSAGFIADGSGSNYSNLTLRRDGGTKWIVANAGTSDKFVIQDGALDTKLAIRGDVGYVGIGTESPSKPLHIKNALDVALRVESTDSFSGIEFVDPVTGEGNVFAAAQNGRFLIQTQGTERLTVSSGGNVGIGTPNPQSTLEAAHTGEAQITISFDEDNDYSAIANSGIVFKNNGSTQVGQLIYNEANSGRLSLGIGSSENITIRSDENVGIGTTDPQSKLAVNGTITSKEVIVTDTPGEWPDFVFADDYELRSLQEVQSFIEQNGHLPEVPSAADVEANGVAVGAMQATLLQKIEELTLYLLEQEQRLEKLTEENKTLHERLSRVERDKP